MEIIAFQSVHVVLPLVLSVIQLFSTQWKTHSSERLNGKHRQVQTWSETEDSGSIHSCDLLGDCDCDCDYH